LVTNFLITHHWYKVTFFIVRADLPERFSISVPAVINNIYRSAVPALKYLPERRSGITTPLLVVHRH